MIRFESKNSLIKWLINNCPRSIIVRSLQRSGAECLGGFSPIPPSTERGWILRVVSPHGRKINVAVLAYKDKPRYGIRILKNIPWECWMGDSYSMCTLYTGDNPLLYKQLRDVTIERKKK